MPKMYFRCSRCHKKVSPIKQCSNCGAHCCYSCLHNYWWELMYLTVREFIRNLRRVTYKPDSKCQSAYLSNEIMREGKPDLKRSK